MPPVSDAVGGSLLRAVAQEPFQNCTGTVPDCLKKALPYAERLARASSAQLILVRVTGPGIPGADSGQSGYTGAQAYIDSLVATLGQRGLAVETATRSGDPANEILEEVRFRRAPAYAGTVDQLRTEPWLNRVA